MWTLLFFTVVSLIIALVPGETFEPKLKRQRAMKGGQLPPTQSPQMPVPTVSLARPLHMAFFEPATFGCIEPHPVSSGYYHITTWI
jgi:hypothetical protein